STYAFIRAGTPRERLAALVEIGLSIAGQSYATARFNAIRAGSGTFVDLNGTPSAEEASVGRYIADKYGLDVIRKPPITYPGISTRGPLTADLQITSRRGTVYAVDIKHLFGANIDTVVSEIRGAQTQYTAVVVRPGQFNQSELIEI